MNPGTESDEPAVTQAPQISPVDENEPYARSHRRGKGELTPSQDQIQDFLRTNELLEQLISLLNDASWQNCSEVFKTTRPR